MGKGLKFSTTVAILIVANLYTAIVHSIHTHTHSPERSTSSSSSDENDVGHTAIRERIRRRTQHKIIYIEIVLSCGFIWTRATYTGECVCCVCDTQSSMHYFGSRLLLLLLLMRVVPLPTLDDGAVCKCFVDFVFVLSRSQAAHTRLAPCQAARHDHKHTNK